MGNSAKTADLRLVVGFEKRGTRLWPCAWGGWEVQLLAEGGLGIHSLAERVDVEISRNAGFGEDEGGVGDLVVPIAGLAHKIMVAEHFTVIGEEDDDGVFEIDALEEAGEEL